MKCIDVVAEATDSTGLAAIKLTALGRPKFLVRQGRQVKVFRIADEFHHHSLFEQRIVNVEILALSNYSASLKLAVILIIVPGFLAIHFQLVYNIKSYQKYSSQL